MRTLYFYGFSQSDDQKQIPIVHPVIDHEYVFKSPIFGGELGFRSNLTSLTRDTANFDPISQAAVANGPVQSVHRRSARSRTRTNCLLRGVPGTYTRLSTEADLAAHVHRSVRPDVHAVRLVRGDVADVHVTDQPGVSNYINVGETDVGRVMPTAGLEYRYPFISVQSWGTQTIEPIAQVILRPNETGVGSFPNEDAQSLIFDDSNLFKINKFSGWDRVEGGGRANVGVQYTAQFNRGGNVNVLFGQSYQLFGQNSFALGGTTNTGLDSGLDTDPLRLRRARLLPAELDLHLHLALPLDENDFTLQRTELETTRQFRPLDHHGDVRQLCRPARRSGSWTAARAFSAMRRFKVNAELGPARRRPLRPAGARAQPDPDRRRLYRRLPHLGPELHYRLCLQWQRVGEPYVHDAAQPAHARRKHGGPERLRAQCRAFPASPANR